ncbi:MFS transporter [Patescibacteria group bacterium]|nr:MFS transporter [Patescibacteria group bacterium]MBU1967096.1 MFS transporter [Patescibacteria group bacterium]MBU2543197.1 MFS transporter [Patescibacteria group bacterium]
MQKNQRKFLRNNLKIFYLTQGLTSLIFLTGTWAAYELKFLTFTQLALIEATFMTIQLLTELPTGAFADLVGKKITVQIGYFLKAFSMVIFAFSQSFEWFLVYAIFLGIGDAMNSGAAEALLYDTLKQAGVENNFSRYWSKLSLVFQIGLSLASLVGGWLDVIWLRLPALGYAAALFLAGIATSGFIEPKVDTEKFTLYNYYRQAKQGIKEISKTTYSTYLSLFYILVGGISLAVMNSFKTIILTDLGYTNTQIGTFLGIARISYSVLLFQILRVDRLVTKKRAFYLFPILLIFSMAPMYWLDKWVALPFIAISMLVSTARWTILAEYTNQVFTSKNRATAISTVSMIIGLFYVVVMLGAGPVMEKFGGSPIIFTILGIISAVTILPLGMYLAKNNS